MIVLSKKDSCICVFNHSLIFVVFAHLLIDIQYSLIYELKASSAFSGLALKTTIAHA